MKRKTEEENAPNKRPKKTNGFYLNNHNNRTLQTEGFSLSLLKSSPNFTKDPFMIKGRVFEGTRTTYFKDGMVNSTTEYKNYKLNGLYVKYEKVMDTCNLYKLHVDQLVGNNTYKKIQCYYKNNQLHGKHTIYHVSGEVQSERDYYEGELHGKISQEKYEANYKHGYKHGNLYRLDSFGNEIREYYENGLLHGTRTKSFPNKKPCKIEEYKEGRLNGTCLTYFKSGGIKSVEEYKDNRLHGKCTVYYKGGKTRTENHYVKGRIIK